VLPLCQSSCSLSDVLILCTKLRRNQSVCSGLKDWKFGNWSLASNIFLIIGLRQPIMRTRFILLLCGWKLCCGSTSHGKGKDGWQNLKCTALLISLWQTTVTTSTVTTAGCPAVATSIWLCLMHWLPNTSIICTPCLVLYYLFAIKYGHRMEFVAVEKYVNVMCCRRHTWPKIDQRDLFVCTDLPYIDADPDRLVCCSCCGGKQVKRSYSCE